MWGSIAAVWSPQETFSAKTPLWRGDKALPGAGIKIVVETLPRCCHDATPQKLAARRGKICDVKVNYSSCAVTAGGDADRRRRAQRSGQCKGVGDRRRRVHRQS